MKTSRACILLSFFAAALMLFPAQAMAGLTTLDLMHMPLEKLPEVEVVITGASRYAEKPSEAPSIVEVITADQIRTYGWKTLGDALNGLHGVYVSRDRNYTTLGVRGFLFTGTSDSRILVMVDGHRMNENVYDSAYVGEEFMLDMALVDHIEYIPGPGSSIYGANAMTAVVNVVTKKGSDINGTQTEIMGGSYRTGEARVTYGKRDANGADLLLSASGFHSDGVPNLFYPEYDDPTTNNGVAHDMDGEYNRRLFGKASYGEFTYTAGYVDRFKRIPTASYNSNFDDANLHTVDKNAYGEAKYNHPFNDQTHIEGEAFYQWYSSIGHYPYFFVTPYYEVDEYSGEWVGGNAAVVTTAFNRQKIIVGTDFQYDISQRLSAVDPFGIYLNSNRDGARAGIYGQDAVTLTDKLTLDAGVRLDYHHMIPGVQLNPRAALIWNPREDTTFKLMYSSAFRAPNIFERDYNAFGYWVSNPDNRAEHIVNYEVAGEWRPQHGLTFTSSVFYNDFSDVLLKDYDYSSPTSHEYVNTGHLRTIGAEFGAQKKWDSGREFKLEFNHSEFVEFSGSYWGEVDTPKNVGKAMFAQPLFSEKAKVGIEDIFVDKRTSLYYNEVPSYNIVNVNLTSDQFIPGVDAAVSIYNALDSNVYMIGGPSVFQDLIPMNGRTFMVTLQKTF